MSLQEIEFLNIKNIFDVEENLSLEETHEIRRNTLELDENDIKCGEIFVSNSGKFNIICALCEESFENIQTFSGHLGTKHSSGAFSSVSSAEIHPKTNFNSEQREMNYIEESQNSAYDDLTQYSASESGGDASDFRETENEPVSKWCCEICHRQYKTKSSLTRHYKCHKTPGSLESGENKFETAPSAASDPRYSSSKQTPRILQQDSSYLKCKYCSKEFLNRLKTLKHERTHDKNGPYSCPFCPKIFRNNSEREMHVNAHTGERPYKCSRCPRAFSTKNYLGQHMRTHLAIKKYVCEVCGKGFIRNVERTIHMRFHTGEKPYQCEECGMNFSANGQLWHHRKRHSNSKTHKCDVCGNVFYLNKHLKEHQIVHSDARPHECTECRRCFPRRKALIAHIKIHSDVKEYVCGICGKAFAQAAGLYSHKKSHGVKIVRPS